MASMTSDWFTAFFSSVFFEKQFPKFFTYNDESFPLQDDTSLDCVLYLLRAIEDICFNKTILFKYGDLPIFRSRVFLDIMNCAVATPKNCAFNKHEKDIVVLMD